MSTFNLPDLGEGLPEAEIVSWHVKEGDQIKTDELLVSVETAKAVVEVPSPYTGTVVKLYAGEGDIVETGKPLVDFSVDGAPASAPADSSGNEKAVTMVAVQEDSGTVVGNMPTSNEVLVETAIAGGSKRRKQGRVKALPSVRALAKQLGVDLSSLSGSGKNGQIVADDVRSAAGSRPAAMPTTRPATAPARAKLQMDTPEPLRGPRRAMAQSMSLSRDEIAQCTIFDDADIHDWLHKGDVTVRVLRALVAGCQAEPVLNAFFDPESTSRQIHERIDIAMAVDTPDGLIVPVLRDCGNKTSEQLRGDVNQLKEATRNRTVAPEDMRDYTITLSNFGMMAGRYATPVVVPPAVAIIGTGGIRHDVVAVMGGIEVHRRIPLSLTFDHRCVTGGEACRFLAAMIADLARPD